MGNEAKILNFSASSGASGRAPSPAGGGGAHNELPRLRALALRCSRRHRKNINISAAPISNVCIHCRKMLPIHRPT